MSDRSVLDRLSGRVNRLSASLVRTRTVRMVNERPIASFTFDDFPKSAVASAAALLEKEGVAGTYYLSRTFNGATIDGIKYYDVADVKRLIDNGHEIGCHTASHLHLPQVSREALIADFESNAAFVRDHVGDVRMTTFAFPFGDIDLSTKLFAQARFSACRTTSPEANQSVADLGALRAVRLYSGLLDPDAVRSLIERHAKPRTWLILYTHDVVDGPSPHGCTPALFESALKSALAAGYQVLPVRNALGAIRFRHSA